MSSRSPQSENSDSTAKLMVEALAKASAELEKSVMAFSEQLTSFNEGIQSALEEELRAVNSRLDGCIRSSLDDLGHSKHMMMRRLLEAERKELDQLSDAGRKMRLAVGVSAKCIEEKIEQFIAAQINELKDFLKQPQEQIKSSFQRNRGVLLGKAESATGDIVQGQSQFQKQLSDKVSQLEHGIKLEADKAREAVAAVGEFWNSTLSSECDSFCHQLVKIKSETLAEVATVDQDGDLALQSTQVADRGSLEDAYDQWKRQIDADAASFNQLISNLGAVLKENFDTKLANVTDQSRQEIALLSEQAREKIAATRSELEVELHALERDYIHQMESALERLEVVVLEHEDDKLSSGAGRQRNAQKLRDQMHTHLKRWNTVLVDSIKDAASHFESEFNHATEGFHVRIEGARASAIELLERENKLMQKDLDRVFKDFQREVNEEEAQIAKIESAGQDAVVTVIACRKAMLSFKGE